MLISFASVHRSARGGLSAGRQSCSLLRRVLPGPPDDLSRLAYPPHAARSRYGTRPSFEPGAPDLLALTATIPSSPASCPTRPRVYETLALRWRATIGKPRVSRHAGAATDVVRDGYFSRRDSRRTSRRGGARLTAPSRVYDIGAPAHTNAPSGQGLRARRSLHSRGPGQCPPCRARRILARPPSSLSRRHALLARCWRYCSALACALSFGRQLNHDRRSCLEDAVRGTACDG